MLLPTDKYDVLLIHQNTASYTFHKRNKQWKVQVVGENADGRFYNVLYSSSSKNNIDWMHPDEIKIFHTKKEQQ